MTGLEAKMEIQDGGAIIVIMGDGTLGGAAIDIKSGKELATELF